MQPANPARQRVRRRVPTSWLSALLVALILAACADTPQDPGSAATHSPPGPPSYSLNLKEVGRGLYLKDRLPPRNKQFIDHVVVTADWADLEPQDQTFAGSGWTKLSEMLEHPEIKVRLRVRAGKGSPSFVKHLGGPPISGDGVDCSEEGGIAIAKPDTTTDGIPRADAGGCIPYFWHNDFLDQYRELMAEVASRYDSHPRLLDVVNSACMTLFAEPFIRAGASRDTNARLFRGGLNETSDADCHRRSLQIHDQEFVSTRVSLATHSAWQIIVDPSSAPAGVATSWEKQQSLLDEFRARYGDKLVVQNNGLGGDEGCYPESASSAHFCWLAGAASPKGFQTEGEVRLRTRGFTVYDAIDQALEMGACFVEHNRFAGDPKMVESYNRRLTDNC